MGKNKEFNEKEGDLVQQGYENREKNIYLSYFKLLFLCSFLFDNFDARPALFHAFARSFRVKK